VLIEDAVETMPMCNVDGLVSAASSVNTRRAEPGAARSKLAT
jgi:hypothetical protein